jgi:hypothetical protein
MLNKKIKEDEEIEYVKAMEIINNDFNRQKLIYVQF